MKDIINKLLMLGVKEEYPRYLSSKIRVTNALVLSIVFFIVIPYIGITYIFFRPLTFLPIVCSILGLLTLVLNRFYLTNLSRFIFGLLPLSLPLIYFAYLTPPGSPKLLEMYVISIAFSIIPFLLFDIRERLYVVINAIIIVMFFVFGLDSLNSSLVMDIDASVVTDGFLGTVNIFMGIALIIVGVLILSYQNYKSEVKTADILEKMDKQTEEVRKSENELKEKIGEIENTREQENKRSWASQGLAEISTILRAEQDTQALYDSLISYLATYLGANQCALFLVQDDEDNPHLLMQATYAYSRKKFLDKVIQPGQGIVGQAYLEKETVYLKDVPDGYLSITSGMGESTPSEILVVPLIVNEEVAGVLEMASFSVFEDHQRAFLEQMGETVASFVNINRINQKTKFFLEEAQQQTEEMRAQEEEMRQNMEELSAIQEEMARKEQEYLSQIEDLKAALGQTEEVS
jgi:putative methionine-R-sulfoxide reductase with GAF domain